ncbi:MAG: hypothetical protein KGJ75_05185 [Alphaproteobacteria bacterium]|nr:hypothetical protein [Alphaproteobacteria bacterium]
MFVQKQLFEAALGIAKPWYVQDIDFDAGRKVLTIAVTDGGEQPVQDCPECGLSTYLLTEDHAGCVWCGLVLGECARCMTGLTPENVSPDNHGLCGYCDNLMSKDN